MVFCTLYSSCKKCTKITLSALNSRMMCKQRRCNDLRCYSSICNVNLNLMLNNLIGFRVYMEYPLHQIYVSDLYILFLQNKKQLFAVVCGVLRYAEIISTILKRTHLLKHEKVLRQKPPLARVLVHEFLFGQGLHKHTHYQVRDVSCISVLLV